MMGEGLIIQNNRDRIRKKKKRDIVLPSTQWNFLEGKNRKASRENKDGFRMPTYRIVSGKST